MDDDKALNAQEAAEMLGAHVETIRRMARRGTLPAYKIGKDWRFRKTALLNWSAANPATTKPTDILVIDDDARVCRLIQRMLMPQGYRVMTAQNGAEGLECLQATVIDLILLDLEMPVMNGLEFIGKLKQNRPQIPVIVVTGNPDGQLMLEASRYGPLLLIAKPFDKKMLLSSVHLALEGTSAESGA